MTDDVSEKTGPTPDEGLRFEADAAAFAALRWALLRLFAEDPASFAELFDPHLPLSGRPRVSAPAEEVAHWLRWFRLAEACDEAGEQGGKRHLRGRSRIRELDGRLYVLDPGYVRQYYQDVWPETDALLQALYREPPGRLLDVATGCGILAIEGAARGHQVVATDLYGSALDLARFNAALNGLPIELRQGHLLEPVRGEQFDLIVILPHYTRVADQLRLEVLRTAPDKVRPGGKLVVAVPLEWEGEGTPAAVSVLLRQEAARGSAVRVSPLSGEFKRDWFTRALPEGDIAGLTSRHRFLITIEPGCPKGGSQQVEMPAVPDMATRRYVPLSRLSGSAKAADPAWAVIASAQDVEALQEVLAGLHQGFLTMAGPLPAGVLDACRYGERPCVTDRVNEGAAGAILDRDGGVRPCTHGLPLSRAEDSMAQVASRWATEAARAAERRGCATCPAADQCSRCLFPFPLDEAAYCELIRARAAALPLLHRLLRFLAGPGQRLPPPLRIKLRPGAARLAARPFPEDSAASVDDAASALQDPHDNELEQRMLAVREALRSRAAWLLADGAGGYHLSFLHGGGLGLASLTPETAEIGELVAEGASASTLRRYLRARPLPLRLGHLALSHLRFALG